MSLRSEQRKRKAIELRTNAGLDPVARVLATQPRLSRYLRIRVTATQLRTYRLSAGGLSLDEWIVATLDANAGADTHRARRAPAREVSRYLSGATYAAELLGFPRLHSANRKRLEFDPIGRLGYALALVGATALEVTSPTPHARLGVTVARVMVRCKELIDAAN